MKCRHDEHPEWIKQRGDKSFYCTVCRMMIFKQTKLEDLLAADAEQGRDYRLFGGGRAARPIRLDLNKPRSNPGEESKDTSLSEDAGREWS